MSVLFITTEALKAESYISENVDPKLLKPTIIMVQDVHLLPILGTALYKDFQAKITSDPTLSGSTDYKTLLDAYIKPVLIWYCMSEFQDINTFKMANKGLLTKNSDNTQAATMSDLLKVAAKIKDKAEWYAQRLTNHLRANTTTYPLYLNQTDQGIDAIHPVRTSYQTGLYLGDSDNTPRSFSEKYQGKYGLCDGE